MSLVALICCWIPLVKGLTDIQFLDLLKPLPTNCFSGIAATYQNKLYAIDGGVCGNNKVVNGECLLEDRSHLQYTLDLSQLQLTGTDHKQIILANSPTWQDILIDNIANDSFTRTKGAYQTTGYVSIDNYAWAIYPSQNIVAATKSIMRYDMSINSYTSQPGNPYDSYIELDKDVSDWVINTCNAHHGNYLYSIGGEYENLDVNYATNDTWRLDLSTNDWDKMKSMPTRRHRMSCPVLNGSIYVLGGQEYHPNKNILNIIEEYVIINNEWLSESSLYNIFMSVGRQQHISHIHPNKQWIITLGGRASDANDFNVPIEIFEPLTHRVYPTNIMYWQRSFYSTLYKYSSDISIIFAYGGKNNGSHYKNVQYMVLHSNDHIPSWTPTKNPTYDPTNDPTFDPTFNPTNNPSIPPTKNPSTTPTINPSIPPTNNPSTTPTFIPTFMPTIIPTKQPITNNPTISPTKYPTISPTKKPSKSPLPAEQTHIPTNDPTFNPITSEPSETPSNIPTRSDPTESPHRDGVISDPSTTLEVIVTTGEEEYDESKDDGFEIENISAMIDNLNNSVNYFMISLICFCIFFMLISFFGNRFIYTGCDPPNYFALLWVIMELYDFFSDVSFSVYLYYLKEIIENGLIIFIFTSIFIYIPYLLNLLYLSHRIRRWKTKLRRSFIGEWLSYWDWWLICLSMLSGGSHPAVEICNSLLFPMDAFGMHLPWTEIVKIRTERFCTTVLFENVPQLCIQLYLLASIEAVTGNSIIYLTILSSVGSIAFSGLYYFVNQHGVKVSQNHWIFRMRLTSNTIEEYHKHSYYKLQVAISKSLELPNVEWVRITSIQHKADELRCDGFISIPDQYLKISKKKENQNDMRRASEMFRNTFDENERNDFMNRLEAVKEEESHYHQTLTKQLKYDIKLNNLKVYFEIGGGKNREGGANQNHQLQPIPIVHFAPEGDINHTGSIDEGPGNGNNNASIEMAMVNHQENNDIILENAILAMNDDEVIDTPGNSISTINTMNNSPFNMSLNEVEKALIDDDEVDNINNNNNDNDIAPGSSSPQHKIMRTDDGMIEQMINDEFELNNKTKQEKSHADIVDEEVMKELENLNDTNTNDMDGEIIDADLNGGIDVDAIDETNGKNDIDLDFEIDTIQ